MNTKYIGIGILAILIVAGVIYAAKTKYPEPQDDYMGATEGVMQKEDGNETAEQVAVEKQVALESATPVATSESVGDGTVTVAVQSGAYIPYDPAKLALAKEGSVVLFFRASWCPTCKALDADIRANLSKIPQGVTILDVDYDSSRDLQQKYGVTYQHTLVQVDADGTMIKKWSGSPTLTDILSQIKPT